MEIGPRHSDRECPPPELIFEPEQRDGRLHAEVFDHGAGAGDHPPGGAAAALREQMPGRAQVPLLFVRSQVDGALQAAHRLIEVLRRRCLGGSAQAS
jgi:hypothetical protein